MLLVMFSEFQSLWWLQDEMDEANGQSYISNAQLCGWRSHTRPQQPLQHKTVGCSLASIVIIQKTTYRFHKRL